MSTTSSLDAGGGSQSQVHTCTITQSQEQPGTATSSGPSRIILSMGFLFFQQATIWGKLSCKAVSNLRNMKAGFWSHVMVAAPLLIAIFTLWPTFNGTADAKKATELAKWTAKRDFIEFCQSVSAYKAEITCKMLIMSLKARLGARWV